MKATGTSKKQNDEKQALRDRVAPAVRQAVPDDVNHIRTYSGWKPGSPRPFMPQFNFQTSSPGQALCAGPGAFLGGKLNGIKDQNAMREQDAIKTHGAKK